MLSTVPWLRLIQHGVDQKASCAELEVHPGARSLTLEGVALSEHPSSGPVAQAIRELLESRPTVLEVTSQSGTTGNVLSWDGGGRRNRPLNFAEEVPTRLTVTCRYSLRQWLLLALRAMFSSDLLKLIVDPKSRALDLKELQRRLAFCNLPVRVNGSLIERSAHPLAQDAEVQHLGEALLVLASGEERSLVNFTLDGVMVGQCRLRGVPVGRVLWGVWPVTPEQVELSCLEVDAGRLMWWWPL